MNINFKKWRANLLKHQHRLEQIFLQDVRKMINKFRSEINQRKFKEVLECVYNDDYDVGNRTYIAAFIASLILQQDMSVLKDVCITTDNCIPERIFAYNSFDEFSSQKLGINVHTVAEDAFICSKAKKIDINGKNELILEPGCFCGIESKYTNHVSAGNYLDIGICAFSNSNLYELKLKAASHINMKINFISHSTIDTLIIDTPRLYVYGIGDYLESKYKKRRWTFSINRLVISKEIIDHWGEEKILKLFRPNILEIL